MTGIQIESLILPLLFVATRVGGVMMALPMFGLKTFPTRMRIVATVAFSVVILCARPIPVIPDAWVGTLIVEFLIGSLMGLVVRLLVASVEFAGEIAGMQMGFGFQKVVNPMSQESNGPVGNLFFALAGVMFFVSEAHHEVLRAILASYYAWPVGSMAWGENLIPFIIQGGAGLFWAGFRIAFPLIIIAFLTQLCFGVLTKVAPQLNVWSLGFACVILMCLIGFSLFLEPIMLEVLALYQQSYRVLNELLLVN